jgi:ribosomal protein S14
MNPPQQRRSGPTRQVGTAATSHTTDSDTLAHAADIDRPAGFAAHRPIRRCERCYRARFLDVLTHLCRRCFDELGPPTRER